MKHCPTCGQDKEVTDFPRNKRKDDGYDRQCKSCTNARMRAAYAADPAPKIARTRQYHLDNPEWSSRVLRDWHQKNAGRRYQDYLERGKDPEVAAKRRESTRRCESRRRAVVAGTVTEHITREDLARLLAAYENGCWICGIELTPELLHWDHFRPLSKGGEHVLDNIRPACAPCNVRKNCLWPVTDEHLDAIRSAVARLRGREEVVTV